MPRGGGNRTTASGAVLGDDTAAHAEFQHEAMSQYGIHSNAQEMIEHHRRSINPAVQRASLIRIDDEATAEAKADMDAAKEKLGLADDETLLDVAVRGNALVGVVEYPNGFTGKVVAGWDDTYKPPKLTPQQAADFALNEAETRVAAEVARLQRDMDLALAEHKADLSAELAQALEELRAENAAAVADASAAAEPKPKAPPHAKPAETSKGA